MTTSTDIRIDRVKVGSRKRPLGDVSGLMSSIADVGLLNPITVDPDCVLLAGLHRLEACKRLGWKKIPAIMVPFGDAQAEMAQIDENLIRNELSALERAEHLARRKVLYLELHPDTAQGVAGGKASGRARKRPAPPDDGRVTATGDEKRTTPKSSVVRERAFVDDTSSTTGRAKSTVRQDVQIGESLTEAERDALRGTPAENNQSALLSIAREKDPEKRAQKVQKATQPKAPRQRKPNPPKWVTTKTYTLTVSVAARAVTVSCGNPNITAEETTVPGALRAFAAAWERTVQ